MTIARQATYTSRLSVVRTYSGEGIGADNTVTVDGLGTQTTLNGSSTPPVSVDACLTLPLVAGAATLDLTAIPDPTLGTVNANGLTPYMLKLQNPDTNANPITIKEGAANGYVGFGVNFLITLAPGEEIAILKKAASAVGGASKTLDLTGTGVQALNIQIAAG